MAEPSLCPYIGLQPYTEADREFFFGREKEKRVISSNLFAASVTILYGASGVGKSSILMAGVVPLLRSKPRTVVVVFREWQRPDFLSALKSEVLKQVPEEKRKAVAAPLDLPLDELLVSLQESGETFLLLLDQFEEFFLYHPESEGTSFDSELARAVNRRDVDASFLLSLREDGLSKVDRFRTRIPNLMANLLRLHHLDASAAEDAIRMPLQAYNARIGERAPFAVEDELVPAVIEQVRSGSVAIASTVGTGKTQESSEVRIETPFLQLVLTRLWDEESASQSRCLRLETLQKLGGAKKIVCSHLDEVMRKLEPDEQRLCAGFFDRMVTPSGAKIACRLDDLKDWAGDLSERVLPVVTRLAESRILRVIAPPPGAGNVPPSYEVFHDVLTPALLDWRRTFLEDQAREEARRQEEQKREEERELADQQAKKRRRVIAGAVATLLIIVLAGTTIVSTHLYNEAETQRGIAERERGLAQTRLQKVKGGIQLLKAALSSDAVNNLGALQKKYPSLFNSKIAFQVRYRDTGERITEGDLARFRIFPDLASIPNGKKAIASITYRVNHPSFKHAVVETGPETDFTYRYLGYGVVDVIAIIEYSDPKEAPSVQVIDMEKLQQPE